MCAEWAEPELAAIHPSRAIAISDDREVTEISARKVASSDGAVSYRVVLEEQSTQDPG